MRDSLILLICCIYLLHAFLNAAEFSLLLVPGVRAQFAIEQRVRGAYLLTFWLRYAAVSAATIFAWRCIGVMLLGFCVFNMAQASVMLQLCGILCCTLVLLLISYMLPRMLAKRYPLYVAIGSMPVLIFLTCLSVPLVWPFTKLGEWLGNIWCATQHPQDISPFFTPDTLQHLADNAHSDRLGGRSNDLFLSIVEFSDTVIREIMVPRTNMVALALNSNREEVEKTVLDAGHSRIPVYNETIDDIAGILHVKDLFVELMQHKTTDRNIFDLKALLRTTFYVPEVMKITELLREFQRRKTHMAIVVDEYGGTAGVVTLEDIIEEIVGEIQDEYDVDEKQYKTISDTKTIADGRVSIWDLEDALKVEFPNDADYETLAGFLMSRLGALPSVGMVIQWNNLRFTIKEANEKRIATVEIERRPKTDENFS